MSETKSGSLVSDFVGVIKSGMEKVEKYKTDCNAFKEEVTGYADELKNLIDQLEACIGEIENLQGQYVAFIQQLKIIQENLRIQINSAAAGAKTGADTECNEKILQIKNEFQGLMGLINELKLETETGMRTQLGRLKSTLKKLCDETDGIVGKMRKENADIKTQVDSMKNEFGVAASPDMEKREGDESIPNTEDDLATYAYKDENDRNSKIMEGGMRKKRKTSRKSKRKTRRKRKGKTMKKYKKRGGWQTKSQLKSINSPIRSLRSKSNRSKKKSISKKSIKSQKMRKSRRSIIKTY